MRLIKIIGATIIILLILSSCKTEQKEVNDPNYTESIKTYRTQRLERLKAPTGWLNLAGLLWLKEGENTLGSDSLNTIIFPEKAKGFIGKIIWNNDGITFMPNGNSEITINDSIAKETLLKTDANGKPDMVKHDDFGWYIIKRGDRHGIRLRDYKSPSLQKLDSIPAYPIDENWKVEAKFTKLDQKKKVNVPTVIGINEEYEVTGELEFKVNGKKQNLTPFDTKSGGFFLIFADETSQNETYPAGRFLYTEKPDKNGNVIIDFNKAYNPPCAFTPYATCPLPPRENILKVAVKAGEKNVHVYEH